MTPVLMLLQVLQIAPSPLFLTLHLWSSHPLPQWPGGRTNSLLCYFSRK